MKSAAHPFRIKCDGLCDAARAIQLRCDVKKCNNNGYKSQGGADEILVHFVIFKQHMPKIEIDH